MIMLGKPQQHVATWRVILGLAACVMSSQFLPVVHRFEFSGAFAKCTVPQLHSHHQNIVGPTTCLEACFHFHASW